MCHTLPRIGYKIPYNKDITNMIPQMIKVGTNVKSKIHDDLTGHVVICEPINNYAVIMTDIIEYEMMTVECFLSDLEVVNEIDSFIDLTSDALKVLKEVA